MVDMVPSTYMYKSKFQVRKYTLEYPNATLSTIQKNDISLLKHTTSSITDDLSCLIINVGKITTEFSQSRVTIATSQLMSKISSNFFFHPTPIVVLLSPLVIPTMLLFITPSLIFILNTHPSTLNRINHLRQLHFSHNVLILMSTCTNTSPSLFHVFVEKEVFTSRLKLSQKVTLLSLR